MVYWKAAQLGVELYTDLKDPVLEAVLDAAGLLYNKTESFIASEKLYEILYEMEV